MSIENNTSNIMTSPNQMLQYDERDIIFVTCFVIIFIIGVTGNILVLYIFSARKRQTSTMERLIFRLAMVDLIASIFNPFLFIYWQLTHNRFWHFSRVGCKILPSLNYFTDSFSIGIIIIIAVDRCRKICQPMKLPYSTNKINFSFLVIVIGGIIMEIPRLVYADVHPKYACVVYNSSAPSFAYPTLTLLITRDLVCIAIFAYVFYRMYRVLYCQSDATILVSNKDKHHKRQRAFILLVSMSVVFILLVYPRDFLHIIYISLTLAPINFQPAKSIQDINTFLKLLRATNSIVNVFLYAGFHQDFRKHLRSIPYEFKRKEVFRGGENTLRTNFVRSNQVKKIKFPHNGDGEGLTVEGEHFGLRRNTEISVDM